jgi:threonine aldolase
LKKDYKKFDHGTLCTHLKDKYKILINPTFHKDAIRVVTHRDVSTKNLEYFVKAIKESLWHEFIN